MNNGILEYSPEYNTYKGNISSLQLDYKIALAPTVHNDPNKPSHDVYAYAGERRVSIGSAWTKVYQSGPHQGKNFLSMSLDDPSFERPLYVSAYIGANDTTFEIKFQRPKKEA